jgi:hypothetical protein
MSGGFDAILGNPPFLNQLETATASSGAMSNIVHARSGGVIRGYADLSATFLMMGSRWLGPGGRLAFVQPQSFLAARDAAPVRRAILAECALTSLWVSNEHVFDDASVFVCAPAFQRGGPRCTDVRRSSTASFVDLPSRSVLMDELLDAETWSHLVAAASGIPEVEILGTAELGSIADVTADFRDQYYGLDGFLVEDADIPAARRNRSDCAVVLTTGLVNLAECLWGKRPTRILKRKWHAPRVDRSRMDASGTLGPWLSKRLVPKVLVATQTRVLEAWVDERADVVPSIPLLTVTPRGATDLWLVAAAVASPVSTAVSLCRYAGAALNADAIKLSAAQVSRLPLPLDADAWRRGAGHLREAQMSSDAVGRRAALLQFGESMSRAYGLSGEQASQVMSWWTVRLGESMDAEVGNAEI